MELATIKIGFGGGCHWCTEAVFQSLKGVVNVEQGWMASTKENSSFSEAVMVTFNPEHLKLGNLIEIHCYTHKSTSNHALRGKYRSAIYTLSKEQAVESSQIINDLQKLFNFKLITKVYPFKKFKASREAIGNYYRKNPEKPICQQYIDSKLKLLLNKFEKHVDLDKVGYYGVI
jgi:peptide-methionine (S)-S-oxide reductase